MREIEFRGKLKNKINGQTLAGSWVYGGYYLGPHGACIREENAAIGLLVIPETVGQYTGIKVADGRKVYEGDIVELTFGGYGKREGVVRWNKNECAFMVFDRETGSLAWLAHAAENSASVRILGNIYDTPVDESMGAVEKKAVDVGKIKLTRSAPTLEEQVGFSSVDIDALRHYLSGISWMRCRGLMSKKRRDKEQERVRAALRVIIDER
jgi:hypothetical protein